MCEVRFSTILCFCIEFILIRFILIVWASSFIKWNVLGLDSWILYGFLCDWMNEWKKRQDKRRTNHRIHKLVWHSPIFREICFTFLFSSHFISDSDLFFFSLSILIIRIYGHRMDQQPFGDDAYLIVCCEIEHDSNAFFSRLVKRRAQQTP